MRFPVFCCRYRLTVVTSKIRIRLRPDIRCRVSESGIRLKINIRPSLVHSKTNTGQSIKGQHGPLYQWENKSALLLQSASWQDCNVHVNVTQRNVNMKLNNNGNNLHYTTHGIARGVQRAPLHRLIFRKDETWAQCIIHCYADPKEVACNIYQCCDSLWTASQLNA